MPSQPKPISSFSTATPYSSLALARRRNAHRQLIAVFRRAGRCATGKRRPHISGDTAFRKGRNAHLVALIAAQQQNIARLIFAHHKAHVAAARARKHRNAAVGRAFQLGAVALVFARTIPMFRQAAPRCSQAMRHKGSAPGRFIIIPPRAQRGKPIHDHRVMLFTRFQLTAARRRLAGATMYASTPANFNSQPREGGWHTPYVNQAGYFYISTHSRAKAAGCGLR